jgi:hypothetical protein
VDCSSRSDQVVQLLRAAGATTEEKVLEIRGSRFGLMEVVLVVAVIAQRYSLKLSAEQRVEANASLTLHPRGGLAMRLHRRT